jgi:16S rRNA processing protein RimM
MPPSTTGDGSGRGDEERLLSVGVIVKPHGLGGDVVVHLTSNRSERLHPGTELQDEGGRTYRVVHARRHKNRYLVTFEGVTTVEEAEARRGTLLLAPPLADPDVLWVHELVGSRVEDVNGRELGVVREVEANPASDLLVLDGGGLIPLRFVVDTTPGQRVVVSVPDGLLDPG